jgi:hypothetical protein
MSARQGRHFPQLGAQVLQLVELQVPFVRSV